jgi:hypothetical protein
VIMTSGALAWRALVILLGLALLASHPLITLALAVAYVARAPLRWFVESTFAGFGAGLGLRASGFARRLSQPPRSPRSSRIQRYRRPPRGYSPNDSFNDEWPENLEG